MASSVISFPTTDNNSHEPGPSISAVVSRPPYQPFRRISLPSGPPPALRPISITNFVQAQAQAQGLDSAPPPVVPRPRPSSGERKQRSRPGSVEYPLQRGIKSNRGVVGFKSNAIMDEQKMVKRNRIIDEFYETEKAYAAGLDLIYEHFLTPILNSLTTPAPLLSRAEITTVFSNFIDIWNLHRAFIESLTQLLQRPASSNASPTTPFESYHPPLSPPLASHFPYLSLYTPYVTAFPATLQTLQLLLIPASPAYSAPFASFIAKQEKDSRCGKLKLRDWLLTIVQRCPRYLLLLKDLEAVEMDESEKRKLIHVKTLVEKITSALNTSLHAHLTTLTLLNLQRNTSGLPFQLIAPGRSLIKRGTLYQVERSEAARERDFLLFSDCLVWIATEESEKEWVGAKHWWQSNNHEKKRPSSFNPRKDRSKEREEGRSGTTPLRLRSRSEAELSEMKAQEAVHLVNPTRNNSTTATTTTTSVLPSPTTVTSPESLLSPPPPPITSLETRQSTPPPPPPITSSSSLPFPSSVISLSPSRPSYHASRMKRNSSSSAIPRPSRKKSSNQSFMGMSGGGGGGDEHQQQQQKWVFKGRRPIVDMDVVILRPPSFHPSDDIAEEWVEDGVEGGVLGGGTGGGGFVDEDEESDEARRFEVHSPSGSFVLYASSGKERDEWVEEIRNARANYLGGLNSAAARGTANATIARRRGGGGNGNGNGVGTLRGSGRKMVALPYKPGDERIGTLSRAPPSGSMDENEEDEKKKNAMLEKRGKVEHFVPPIWIPDSKTGECMRCGRSFGWRRRRHHCRLCGRCVCSSCSERTFYISDGKEKEKPARGCNACYETVFPVIPTPSFESIEEDFSIHQAGQNTIGSLTNFPGWTSMPSLPLDNAQDAGGNAAALMAIDSTPMSYYEEFEEFEDDEGDGEEQSNGPGGVANTAIIEDGRRVIKKRDSSYGRPGSFIQIVDDFYRERPPSEVILNSDEEEDESGVMGRSAVLSSSPHFPRGFNSPGSAPHSPLSSSPAFPQVHSPRSRRSSRVSFVALPKRKEDTMRKKKRFSLPAVALHATSVTAHSGGGASTHDHHQPQQVHGPHPHLGGGPSLYKREKRFSLVLGGVTGVSKSRVVHPSDTAGAEGGSLANGVAAGALTQLLTKSKVAV